MPREQATVTTTELAEALGVHRNTILNWIDRGELTPDRVTTLGWSYWRPSSVERLKRKHVHRAA